MNIIHPNKILFLVPPGESGIGQEENQLQDFPATHGQGGEVGCTHVRVSRCDI